MALPANCPVSVDRLAAIVAEGLLSPMSEADLLAFSGYEGSDARWYCDPEFILIASSDSAPHVVVYDEEDLGYSVAEWILQDGVWIRTI